MPTLAQSIKVETIVPDIKQFTVVAMSPCLPAGYKATAMCLIVRKDDQEYLAIHDIETKEIIELRTPEKQVWHRSWIRA